MSGQASVRLTQRQDYQFDIEFGEGMPVVRSDEPAPLGRGEGPSPLMLLASAVGNCLADSLLFALRKFKQQPDPIRAEVEAETGRNDQGRIRVTGIKVRLSLGVPGSTLEHLERVLASFEAYCTVTQSVGAGIPIEVSVYDSEGAQLK